MNKEIRVKNAKAFFDTDPRAAIIENYHRAVLLNALKTRDASIIVPTDTGDTITFHFEAL